MYAKFDRLVAEEEERERAEAERRAEAETGGVNETVRARVLASLPAHMRDDPHILRSLQDSESFRAFSREIGPSLGVGKKDLRMTRDDVEKWARGEDDDFSELIPGPLAVAAPATPALPGNRRPPARRCPYCPKPRLQDQGLPFQRSFTKPSRHTLRALNSSKRARKATATAATGPTSISPTCGPPHEQPCCLPAAAKAV